MYIKYIHMYAQEFGYTVGCPRWSNDGGEGPTKLYHRVLFPTEKQKQEEQKEEEEEEEVEEEERGEGERGGKGRGENGGVKSLSCKECGWRRV